MTVEFLSFDFAPIMDYPDRMPQIDLSKEYDSERIRQYDWAAGGYNERRQGMYTAPQYNNERNIHMGIDIWAKEGRPVYTFWSGTIAYVRDNDERGNYGGTIVTRHRLGGGDLYALYGHLSKHSLQMVQVGQFVDKGTQIGELGRYEENGGWVPHLHFQLSLKDPGEADMPGVVAESDREEALNTYPDPRLVLGNLF